MSTAILCAVQLLLLGAAAFICAERCFPELQPLERGIRGAVIGFAVVVAIGFIAGAIGAIRPVVFVLATAGFVGAVLATSPRTLAVGASSSPLRGHPGGAGLCVAIAAFVVGMGLSHSPYTAYDAVSYHLFFPARWLQSHHLSIIPTPFSDEAQAYQPGNGELWFLWLMLPLHGDLLARIGQFPFYVLGALVSYALAVRCGAARHEAVYAPILFLITPPIVEQAVGANVDLIAAVMFLVAMHLGIAAADSNRAPDWAIWGAAVGLFLGTKYLSLVFVPVVVLVPLVRGLRLRALWAVPGILALGLPWYLRNWMVAGSPIYPATLAPLGLTIGRGAYTHRAMLDTFMHTTNVRLLAVSLVHAFGTTMFFVCAPIFLVAGLAVIRRRAWWPAGAVVLAVMAVVALCWTAVGDNTDARFLLPAVALTPAVLPPAFGLDRRLSVVLHAVLMAGVVWVLVGINRQMQLDLPWFMADWLPLRGIVTVKFLWLFGALAAVAALVHRALSDRRVVVSAVLVSLAAAAGVTLAIGADRWCRPAQCDYLQVTSPHIRPTILDGARWLTDHVSGANVAYTGDNVPYPLAGRDLSNAVFYVNIDRHTTWRFDEYVHWFRHEFPNGTTVWPLAHPSGVLMPSTSTLPDVDAVRPRFERRVGDRDAWKVNLQRERIRYVFISTLDPYEADYVWHNAQGFPIEDEWARAEPPAFRLVYENGDVRIYEVPWVPRRE